VYILILYEQQFASAEIKSAGNLEFNTRSIYQQQTATTHQPKNIAYWQHDAANRRQQTQQIC